MADQEHRWAEPGTRLTDDVLDLALGELYGQPMEPDRLPLSPVAHAKACVLLGKPEGSPLTRTEVYEAATIELHSEGA